MNNFLELQKLEFQASIRTMIVNGSKEPVKCPCCEHKYKLYKKSISGRMARTLIDMFIAAEKSTAWVHVPSTKKTMCQNYQDLRFWGLIEENKNGSKIGGRTSGLWRVTSKGIGVLSGDPIPKYAHVYLSKCYGFSGDSISIDECYQRFDYDELMAR